MQNKEVYVYQIRQSLNHRSEISNLTRKIMKCFHPIILILAVTGIPLLFPNIRENKDGKDLFNTPASGTVSLHHMDDQGSWKKIHHRKIERAQKGIVAFLQFLQCDHNRQASQIAQPQCYPVSKEKRGLI